MQKCLIKFAKKLSCSPTPRNRGGSRYKLKLQYFLNCHKKFSSVYIYINSFSNWSLQEIYHAMNETLFKIHNVDIDAVGLGDFGKRGKLNTLCDTARETRC